MRSGTKVCVPSRDGEKVDRGGIEPPTSALRTRHHTPKPPALGAAPAIRF